MVQYGIWLSNLVKGGLGQSLMLRVPVMEVLRQKVVNSLILTGASLLIGHPHEFSAGHGGGGSFSQGN